MSTDYYAHPTAVIDEPVSIGAGTKVWHFCHVMRDAVIGEGCILGQNVFVASGVSIGSRTKIQNNVSVYAGCVVEEDVFLGPSCVLTNVTNPRADIERKDAFETTRIRRGATIGANATIVCGVTVGRWAFVGAGAVVTRDVADYALVQGVPARAVGFICRCGERLEAGPSDDDSEVVCDACGSRYALRAGQLSPRDDDAGES